MLPFDPVAQLSHLQGDLSGILRALTSIKKACDDATAAPPTPPSASADEGGENSENGESEENGAADASGAADANDTHVDAFDQLEARLEKLFNEPNS
jgi:hypothetical protein